MSWSHGRTRRHHSHTKDRVHVATPRQEHRLMNKSPLRASCCFSQSATLVRHPGKLEPIANVQPNREDSTRSEEVESSQSGVRLTGTSNFANAEAQKPATTAAGRCMDRQCSQQKSTAPAAHEYQTGVSVDNTTKHEARRSGTRMSLTWQLTIRIGYDDPDRLITYPDAHNVSGCSQPIRIHSLIQPKWPILGVSAL